MPFVNASNDPNTEYLSDGISESLINSLSQLPQLKVIASSSTFQYKGKEIDPQEVAKALSVQGIVIGRVVQRGDNLLVSAELVNATDKTEIWGERYNCKAADLQAVQEEIVRAITEKLRLRLTGAQEQRLERRATQNPEAYQLYLDGIYYIHKGGKENGKKALDYFNQAIALDPNFARAYGGLVFAYHRIGLNDNEAHAKGKVAAQKALELDATLPEAHYAMAGVKREEWDWSGAESEYKRALELGPNYAGAYAQYGGYLTFTGRGTEALAEIQRTEELDPVRITFRKGSYSIFYAPVR